MASASFYAITDPVVRLLQGLDDADKELAESALTEDATLDLPGLGNTIPLPPKPLRVLKGRDEAVQAWLYVGSRTASTHILSNFRITRAWKEGKTDLREVTNFALASIYRPGEAHDQAKPGYTQGNRYRCEVVRMDGEVDEATGEDRWRIRLFVAWNVWAEGDRSVNDV